MNLQLFKPRRKEKDTDIATMLAPTVTLPNISDILSEIDIAQSDASILNQKKRPRGICICNSETCNIGPFLMPGGWYEDEKGSKFNNVGGMPVPIAKMNKVIEAVAIGRDLVALGKILIEAEQTNSALVDVQAEAMSLTKRVGLLIEEVAKPVKHDTRQK